MIRFMLLADAICASKWKGDTELHPHAGQRYRGMEGSNGAACDECRAEARAVLRHMERIGLSKPVSAEFARSAWTPEGLSVAAALESERK